MMANAEKIEPALTEGEWRQAMKMGPAEYDSAVGDTPALRAYLIALNNAALPDSDPRKITRERIENAIWTAGNDQAKDSEVRETTAFLKALASYLPPE